MTMPAIHPSSLERVPAPEGATAPAPARSRAPARAAPAGDEVVVSDAARQRYAESATESGRGLQLDFKKLRELAGAPGPSEPPPADPSE